MLSSKAEADKKNWDLLLPLTLLTYRTSVHDSTGETPYRVLYNREATLPIDLMYGLPELPPRTPAEYIWDLRKDLADSFCKIRERLQTESRRQKKWYDRRTIECHFDFNDSLVGHAKTILVGQNMGRTIPHSPTSRTYYI
ncbi:hypothetical protein T06_3641 [Trichinella sp. T6]|nr:hypothetical protein T06_3641 [Trichinella sp. T6]